MTVKSQQVWRHLEMVVAWQRKNLPFLQHPQGTAVLVWLLKGGSESRPLKDLYARNRFSEPTLRGVLKSMVDDGLIIIHPSPDDGRVRAICVTQKLLALVDEYLRLLRECPDLLDGRETR